MKQSQNLTVVVLVIVAMLFAGFGVYYMSNGGALSSVDKIVDPETGEAVSPWANSLVNYNLIVSDVFTGADVSASIKVYDVKPTDFGNARGTFSEAKDYTIYTASSGVIEVDKEYPGTYYGVLTATGYNTEFVTFTIPAGENRGDLADYQSNPDSKATEMALVGTTTDEDFAFTLVNGTDKSIKDSILLTVNENTEFRGWKVIISDEEGFSLDTDGDGTYDEGIKKLVLSVGGVETIIFEPTKGTDLFDSNDEYTMLLNNVVVADDSDLVVKLEIIANTGDYTGANDEVWGEGEGVLSYIKIYDNEGSLFATVDATA